MPTRPLYRGLFLAFGIALVAGVGYAAVKAAGAVNWRALALLPLAAALLSAYAQELAGTAIAQAALAAFAQRVGFWKLLVVVTAATSTNSLVPIPAGVPARLWLQKSFLRVPVGVGTLAVTLELLSSYGVLCLSAALGSLYFGTRVVELSFMQWALIGGVALAAAAVAWMQRARLTRLLGDLAGTRPRLAPASITVALNVLVIALASLRLHFILASVGQAGPSLWALAFALSIARVVGVASMIPMGLGSRDITLASLLALSGISLETAALIATIDRVLSMLPYVSFSLIGWPLLRRSAAPDDAPANPD